jgi:hypothetical protein
VERIQDGKIAFARHAECVARAVHDQLVDQHLGRGAPVVLIVHRTLLRSPRHDPGQIVLQ